MDGWDLPWKDRDPRRLGDWRWQQSLPQQIIEESFQRQQEVPGLLPGLYSLFLGVPAELRRTYRAFQEAMVTGPMGVPMPVSKAIAGHDEDALEVLAFTKTLAGKLEEA